MISFVGTLTSSTINQRRKVSKSPVFGLIDTRISVSYSYFFLVESAIALSNASKIFSRGNNFSLDTASAASKISLLIFSFAPFKILQQHSLFECYQRLKLVPVHQRLKSPYRFQYALTYLAIYGVPSPEFANALRYLAQYSVQIVAR